MVECPPEDVGVFLKVAAENQKLAKALGDKQNSDSTLTSKQCVAIVNALLNAGNLLEEAAKRTINKETVK